MVSAVYLERDAHVVHSARSVVLWLNVSSMTRFSGVGGNHPPSPRIAGRAPIACLSRVSHVHSMTASGTVTPN
jgi:hypothetical protein